MNEEPKFEAFEDITDYYDAYDKWLDQQSSSTGMFEEKVIEDPEFSDDDVPFNLPKVEEFDLDDLELLDFDQDPAPKEHIKFARPGRLNSPPPSAESHEKHGHVPTDTREGYQQRFDRQRRQAPPPESLEDTQAHQPVDMSKKDRVVWLAKRLLWAVVNFFSTMLLGVLSVLSVINTVRRLLTVVVIPMIVVIVGVFLVLQENSFPSQPVPVQITPQPSPTWNPTLDASQNQSLIDAHATAQAYSEDFNNAVATSESYATQIAMVKSSNDVDAGVLVGLEATKFALDSSISSYNNHIVTQLAVVNEYSTQIAENYIEVNGRQQTVVLTELQSAAKFPVHYSSKLTDISVDRLIFDDNGVLGNEHKQLYGSHLVETGIPVTYCGLTLSFKVEDALVKFNILSVDEGWDKTYASVRLFHQPLTYEDSVFILMNVFLIREDEINIYVQDPPLSTAIPEKMHTLVHIQVNPVTKPERCGKDGGYLDRFPQIIAEVSGTNANFSDPEHWSNMRYVGELP